MNHSVLSEISELKTIIDFIRYGVTLANRSHLYYGHGTDNSWDDLCALILGSLSLPLDCDPSLLQANLTSTEKEHVLKQLTRRIEDKIPVPYLINKAYFCDLQFYVDERVLIPRSPIAELIRQQFSPWIEENQVHRILDLCTGSGCIAIACCHAFPNALVDAVDLSTDALDVAAMNKEHYHLQDSLKLIQSDCWQNVPRVQYDIIVSNPPYVGNEEMSTLPKEYCHEPDIALRAADNGLAIIATILAKAHHYLSEQGILVVEVGNSEDAVIEAYPDLPFIWLDFVNGGQGVFLLTCQQLKDYLVS